MEKTYNRTNGEYLGYPSCCIEAFGDIAVPMFQRSRLVRLASVNGFVPCEEHAEKLLDGTTSAEELINPNRKCSIPFTQETTATQEALINRELNLNQKTTN